MKIPNKCPCCQGGINIHTVKCVKCGTTMTNNFELSLFDRLSDEQVDFLLTFVKVEGNIKEMEKLYNISYPTVKGRLTALKSALELEKGKKINAMNILQMVENGEITAQEAVKLIELNRE